ncbi:YceD family protein [Falsigemmobacter intermedius]|uniref:DUF177 domain-containing protein n=1 Tax=Falsigemmobacter intermedius TaxID=1553448 RepID=A0A3S3VT06_9RHOB|nr:DUF177 domain-containing protein [Falsigemmobacter intermedius]RWY41687.1 DUF177 domain-containing protein [Falsigemmobacter intermedius]
MAAEEIRSNRIRTAELTGNRKRSFKIRPGKPGLAALAEELGLQAIKDLTFKGELAPAGREDVSLIAQLEADVVQSCVVTLAPVPAKIKVPVERHYVAGMEYPDAEEAEMPEDDTREPLPDAIDLDAVLIEALALALPDYPRAAGAETVVLQAVPPGAEPIEEEKVKPFAALAALKAKLEK